MNSLLILPIAIPFLAGILCIIAWQQRHIQRILALVGTVALVLAGTVLLAAVNQDGIQITRVGDWPVPFGIVLVADLFSAIMVLVAGLVGLSVVIYSLGSIDAEREAFGYYPVVLTLLMGACGAFLTGDLFNLYVWFEIILISSFVLLALGGQRAQLEGAIKYFAINLLVSAFFLAGVGILYGLTGSLNMADLSQELRQVENSGLVTVVAMIFLVAFGIKSAVFPFFFWLPAAYHTPPVAVTTLFSGLMTKVGVYAMIRVFTLLFTDDAVFIHNLILVIAAFTMVIGVLGAVAQYDFRRLLSFHIISQIGYLMMGLGIFTVASLAGTIFFMAHVIIAKSALFLVSGASFMVAGTYDLKHMGGLYKNFPLLAVLFFIPAMALAGIPPLSGFWAKFALIAAGLEAEQYVIVLVALVVSVLTLFSMTKIWAEAFWKVNPDMTDAEMIEKVTLTRQDKFYTRLLPIALLAVLTIILGVAAEPFLNLATRAADQLINTEAYIQAVLGGN